MDSRIQNLRTGLQMAALAQFIEAMDAAPVIAIERSWKQRRHHRRLNQGNTNRPIFESYMNKHLFSTRRLPKSKRRKSYPGFRGLVKEFQMTAKNRTPHVGIPSAGGPESWIGNFRRSSHFLPPVAHFFLGAYALFFVLAKVQQFILGWNEKKKRTPGTATSGKWVYDRSLGGKKIFVASEGIDWNPLGDTARSLRTKKEGKHIESPPSWWTPRSYIYVEESKKLKRQQAVQKIIQQLNNTRISGQDYPFDSIIELYLLCETTNISAKISRDNVAKSIYKYAVNKTVLLVAEGIGLPFGLDVIPFLCGLSEVLRIESRDAVAVIHSETAIKLRSALLLVFVDIRSLEPESVSKERGVRSVLKLLDDLPTPSAEAEMVGSSITTATTEQERIQAFDALTDQRPRLSEVIGMLLGRLKIAE